jgi:uncharacterized iron-regulated membrane protein
MKKNVYFGLWIFFLIATLAMAVYVGFFHEGSKTAWALFILLSAIFSSKSYTMWRKERRAEKNNGGTNPMKRTTKILLIILGIVIALSTMGFIAFYMFNVGA